MAYIGNTVQTQGFTPQIDYFNGNGSTVTFTLSRPVVSVAQMIVAIDNVIQNPSSAFTVSGNSITFTSAPLSGTNNIWVEYTSLITTYAALSQDPSVVGDITASGGYLSTGDFGNSYVDGVIVDYVTGAARLTTGPLDDMTFYHGGSSSRSEMMKLSYAGNSTLTGNLAISGSATVQGLTVGKGGGNVSQNTAFGINAIGSSNTGNYNTAVGYQAGYSNTTGAQNTFIGRLAGYSNTADFGTAVGSLAMQSNTSGASNTAVGFVSLNNNTTGSNNVAVGRDSLASNTTASNNTAVGYQAGYTNSTSTQNTFVGFQAGFSSNNDANTFFGWKSGYSTTGTSNTFLGDSSGNLVTTGANNTIIGRYNGNQGGVDIRTASNHIVISDGAGNPKIWMNSGSVLYVPGIYSNTSANSANVVSYGANGDLYRSTSALKYKQDIRDLPSIDIGKFRPVVYKSKCANDDQTIDHFGVIADEVDQAGIKELVSYGDDGEVENFKYDRLTVVLLKAIQEQQAMIEELKTKVAALEAK